MEKSSPVRSLAQPFNDVCEVQSTWKKTHTSPSYTKHHKTTHSSCPKPLKICFISPALPRYSQPSVALSTPRPVKDRRRLPRLPLAGAHSAPTPSPRATPAPRRSEKDEAKRGTEMMGSNSVPETRSNKDIRHCRMHLDGLDWRLVGPCRCVF